MRIRAGTDFYFMDQICLKRVKNGKMWTLTLLSAYSN